MTNGQKNTTKNKWNKHEQSWPRNCFIHVHTFDLSKLYKKMSQKIEFSLQTDFAGLLRKNVLQETIIDDENITADLHCIRVKGDRVIVAFHPTLTMEQEKYLRETLVPAHDGASAVPLNNDEKEEFVNKTIDCSKNKLINVDVTHFSQSARIPMSKVGRGDIDEDQLDRIRGLRENVQMQIDRKPNRPARFGAYDSVGGMLLTEKYQSINWTDITIPKNTVLYKYDDGSDELTFLLSASLLVCATVGTECTEKGKAASAMITIAMDRGSGYEIEPGVVGYTTNICDIGGQDTAFLIKKMDVKKGDKMRVQVRHNGGDGKLTTLAMASGLNFSTV